MDGRKRPDPTKTSEGIAGTGLTGIAGPKIVKHNPNKINDNKLWNNETWSKNSYLF